MSMVAGGTPARNARAITSAIGDSRDPIIGLNAIGEARVVWSDWRSGNAEIYLKVANETIEGLDLAVFANGLTLEPPTAVVGEALELQVEVFNLGDARAPSSVMEVSVDEVAIGRKAIPQLDAGSSTVVALDLSLTEGQHVLTVVVDPDRDLEEDNLGNNGAERSVYAYPKGTLDADAGPDQHGQVGQPVFIDATGTVYVGTGVLSFEWDLGDGTGTEFGMYVEHVYRSKGTFVVTLRVSDGTIEDTDTARIEVSERDDPPRAVIDPPGIIEGDRLTPVQLSSELSTDDNGIDNVTWDMGDGTVLTTPSVTHTYSDHGVYVVQLTVRDVADQFDINTTTVVVVNLLPELEDLVGPPAWAKGEEATFSVDPSDPDGSVSAVGWDFDDRDGIVFQAQGTTVHHVFTVKGTYNVTCIVRDNDGGQTVATLEIVVRGDEVGTTGDIDTILLVIAGVAIGVALAALLHVRFKSKEPYQSGNYNGQGIDPREKI
jgi:LPXTG-motif cell wall-anchored protein